MPFLWVIARDTTHASTLMNLIQSDAFFDGRYKTRVIQVDFSKTGAEEDAMVERLLRVEDANKPTGTDERQNPTLTQLDFSRQFRPVAAPIGQLSYG